MGLTYKNNAPVKFITGNYVGHNDRTCHTDQLLFCQYMERLDTTLYQVGVTANSVELVTAGDFSTACGVDWTCGANWAIAAGVATHTAGVGGNLTQPVCIMNDRYYRVRFDIDAITGTLAVELGGNVVGVFSTTGSKEVYILLAAISTTQVQFIPGTDSCTIDDVSVFEFSQIGYEIETDDGVSIFTDITSATPSRDKGTSMISVDWTQAPIDGCYVVCNHEADEYREMICNGAFFEDAIWAKDAGWTIAGGVASLLTINPGVRLTQTLLHNLIGGRCYTLNFDMSNFVGGFLDIRLLDLNILVCTGFTGNGAKVCNIDLTALGSETRIAFETQGAGQYDIDNVTVNMDTVCFEEDACSECYELTDDWDDFNICTQLMSWTNSDNAFNFEYENLSFTQRLRHPSELWKPTYSLDQIDHLDSAGTSTILRAQSFKVSDLDMDMMPEYLHDSMRLAIRHDTFNIDAVQYFALPQDYDPDWSAGRDSEVAPVIIPVRLTTEDNVNENCV